MTPTSFEDLIRMTRVERGKLADRDDLAGTISLAAVAAEDQESLDLVDGLRGDDLVQRIADAGGVPLADAVVPPLDYMVRPDADGRWVAAAQQALDLAFSASQGPTRDFGPLLSEAERAVRRARTEAAVGADELPPLPDERALPREKLARARNLVRMGLEARDPADRHAAVRRLAEAVRAGL
jgi:hypothetical protein